MGRLQKPKQTTGLPSPAASLSATPTAKSSQHPPQTLTGLKKIALCLHVASLPANRSLLPGYCPRAVDSSLKHLTEVRRYRKAPLSLLSQQLGTGQRWKFCEAYGTNSVCKDISTRAERSIEKGEDVSVPT